MDIFELKTVKASESDVTYAVGGNKENSTLPMIFSICGDFTIHNEDYSVGGAIRLKTNGFDEEVKLLAMSKEKITIATSHAIGKKLIASGNKSE